mmetsp:Transcript_622/g.1658  ORF Transcript_622/g.1658 Transcript_622/m.1658 type:complete len:268 (+) Transcript_622:253-1056(+)
MTSSPSRSACSTGASSLTSHPRLQPPLQPNPQLHPLAAPAPPLPRLPRSMSVSQYPRACASGVLPSGSTSTSRSSSTAAAWTPSSSTTARCPASPSPRTRTSSASTSSPPRLWTAGSARVAASALSRATNTSRMRRHASRRRQRRRPGCRRMQRRAPPASVSARSSRRRRTPRRRSRSSVSSSARRLGSRAFCLARVVQPQLRAVKARRCTTARNAGPCRRPPARRRGAKLRGLQESQLRRRRPQAVLRIKRCISLLCSYDTPCAAL